MVVHQVGQSFAFLLIFVQLTDVLNVSDTNEHSLLLHDTQ